MKRNTSVRFTILTARNSETNLFLNRGRISCHVIMLGICMGFRCVVSLLQWKWTLKSCTIIIHLIRPNIISTIGANFMPTTLYIHLMMWEICIWCHHVLIRVYFTLEINNILMIASFIVPEMFVAFACNSMAPGRYQTSFFITISSIDIVLSCECCLTDD